MGFCGHCGARKRAGDHFCAGCGATTQPASSAGVQESRTTPPSHTEGHEAPPNPSARRGKLLAVVAGGSALVAAVAAGGLFAAGVFEANDSAAADRPASRPLPPVPTRDRARFPDRSRLGQLGKLPGSFVVLTGGEPGSAGPLAHAVLVSNSSVAVVCGQIRRQWLTALDEQRYRSDSERADTLAPYLRGGDECSFGGKGTSNGKKFTADVFARRLGPADPRIALAAKSPGQRLESLAGGAASAFSGSYTEVQIATDAPFYDAAREKRRIEERRRRTRAAARERTQARTPAPPASAAPSTATAGASGQPTSFQTGTSPGQSLPAAYCRMEGSSDGAGVYCWTPNDGYTLRLDSGGARRVRADEGGNRGVAPGYGELPLGSSRSRSGYTCTSQDSGLTCSGPSGSGFALPRYRGVARLF